MGRTLADLRTDTRYYLDETDSSNSNFPNAEIDNYLNRAARKVAVMLEWPLANWTATSVLDQGEYTLPSTFIYLTEVSFDGRPLDIVDRADMKGRFPAWETDESGEPIIAYRVDNNVLGFHPEPDANSASKTIRLSGLRMPATISDDDDEPDLAEILQDLLPLRAAYYGQIRAGNRSEANALKNDFNEDLQTFKSKVNKFAEDLMAWRW